MAGVSHEADQDVDVLTVRTCRVLGVVAVLVSSLLVPAPRADADSCDYTSGFAFTQICHDPPKSGDPAVPKGSGSRRSTVAPPICFKGLKCYKDGVLYGGGRQSTTRSRVSPSVAARHAVARLVLPAPRPSIGPPPSINEWKMAAVGYPLWLWTGGASRLSTRVEEDGFVIVLTATKGETTFAMGDGGSVTCSSMTKWTREVTPGAPSPDCGYRYQRASLPRGSYTVTASTTWTVHWSADGESGSVPITRSSSTELPVGELQSLVTKRR